MFLSPSQMFTPQAVQTGTPLVAPTSGQLPAAPNAVAATPAEPTAPTNPMGEFADLFSPTLDAAGQPVVPVDAHPAFVLDPKVVMDTAGKMDFSKNISPELMTKIAAGGPEAMAATVELMNKMSQLAFAQATIAGGKVTEQALNAAEARFASKLPEYVKTKMVDDGLAQNPIFSNPTMAPFVSQAKSQILTKFPEASAQQVQEMTVNLFKKMADSINPAQVPAAQGNNKSNTSDKTNWAEWFTS